MRYFKLMYDYENDDKYANCDVADIGSMNEYIVSDGKTIDKWNKVRFEYNSLDGNVLTDYLANVYRWLLVSSDFRKITNTMIKSHVQYLPVKVIDRAAKTEIDTYSVANIVTLADALDLERSVYDIFELDGEKIISIQKYALKKNKISGQHIFRLKGETIPVFVSQTLKKVIEENNLLGFAFLEVEVI